MFILAFINSGVIIQLVYFKWLPNYDLFFAKQKYESFNSEWYTEVGQTIAITVMLFIITPHASNIGFQCFLSCSRCCDRGCSCNRKKTKKVIQEDYEQVNMGNDFMLEFRYANILTILSVVFLYSSGIPILYFFAALFFFITYWIDKCLLLKCYKKPVMFDEFLAIQTL